MRWNWAKDITAWGHIEISGQICTGIWEYFGQTKFPFMSNRYRTNLFDFTTSPQQHNGNKIFGYIYLAMKLGELSLFQACEFVRIFLVSLQAQYEGGMDKELMDKLQKLARDVYSVNNGNFRVNSRYQIALPVEDRDTISELTTTLEPYTRGRDDAEFKFIKDLIFAGHKLSNFMILLRKRAPHKASADVYMKSLNKAVDVEGMDLKYRKIKKNAYSLALKQLEKDKRRIINEINKPEIDNIVGDDGQGTLFSSNI